MTARQPPFGGPADQVGSEVRFPMVAVAHPADRGLLSLEDVARRCGVHPQLISRFVTLSLVQARRDEAGLLWFDARAPATVARALRLHAGLGLNYAALGLVLDLLDRIERLEAELRRDGRRR
nr:chaperone modulator CbpM [Catenulispora pinisilvae]